MADSHCKAILPTKNKILKNLLGAVLRWQKNRIGRPLSPSKIHQKNITTLSKFHKTTSECWQRTSGTQQSRSFASKTVQLNSEPSVSTTAIPVSRRKSDTEETSKQRKLNRGNRLGSDPTQPTPPEKGPEIPLLLLQTFFFFFFELMGLRDSFFFFFFLHFF